MSFWTSQKTKFRVVKKPDPQTGECYYRVEQLTVFLGPTQLVWRECYGEKTRAKTPEQAEANFRELRNPANVIKEWEE